MSESKYVAVAMVSNLQVLALASPVLVIVSGQPIASMFLRSAVVFFNDFGVLLFIFVPKWQAFRKSYKIESSGMGTSATTKTTSVPSER
mmetsp:Transcript_17676/g.56429  ORF Transcript_17676/g.56429 Transcript_17676/m.56429 type:complete len:89 (-) Transcript_17676:150-416(-)